MKKKILSFLLALSMLAVTAPSVPTLAAGDGAGDAGPAVLSEEDGLFLSRSVSANPDGSYHVELDAYVTADHQPIDVFLVLDQTTRMQDSQDEMKAAVNAFIDEVAARYIPGLANHRVGIITYGDNETLRYGLAEVNAAGQSALKEAVDSLNTPNAGDRDISGAMALARDQLAAAGSYGERQAVVILLTTGNPKDRSYDFSSGVANGAIGASLSMKQQGALVYSVGMFEEADPNELYGSSGFWHNSDGTPRSHWCERRMDEGDPPYARDIPANNRFLNYLSSNSLSASSLELESFTEYDFPYFCPAWRITENFACDPDRGYYKAFTDPNAMEDIFTSILNETLQAHIQLGPDAVLQETVSPYFTVKEGSLQYSTVDYNGTAFAGEKVPAAGVTNIGSGNLIQVTGFDYNANCVTAKPRPGGVYGKKLVVEFDIVPKAGFIGGNAVPVAGADSGMYNEGSAVGTIPVDTVNVPLDYAMDPQDAHIFLGNTVDLKGILSSAAGLDGTNNAFVDIVYTLKDPTGTLGTYTVRAGQGTGVWDGDPAGLAPALTETTTYTVEYAVTPNPEGAVGPLIGSADFTVTVDSGALAISKSGAAGETAVFNIYKDNGASPYMTVTVWDGAPTTIIRLPEGIYRVEADASRSWRYGQPAYTAGDSLDPATAVEPGNTVAINAAAPEGSVACAFGQPANTQWLDGSDEKSNTAKGGTR